MRSTPSRSTLRQPWQHGKITSDQRLFLFSSPTFYLALCGYSILDPVEGLMEDEGYWPSVGGVAIKSAGLVFGDSGFQPTARRADVIRAVSAAKDVEEGAHVTLPATARSISASKFAAMA